jgi:formylmethanofuran dehydrogenase subunit D
MSLNNLILLTGRTINQGVALEGGKISKENVRVKITTDFGEVIVYSIISEEGPHPGIIFVPMGPWANQLVNPDSQSCGTPTYKGMKAKVEVIKNGKVLDALDLIKALIEA